MMPFWIEKLSVGSPACSSPLSSQGLPKSPAGHQEVIRTGDVGVTESFHTFCILLLKRENTSLKQDKQAFFFVFRTQKGSHVKEHTEGVKSQIKEIKEDINNLGNDGFNVEVKLDELEQYARRLSRNNRYSGRT